MFAKCKIIILAKINHLKLLKVYATVFIKREVVYLFLLKTCFVSAHNVRNIFVFKKLDISKNGVHIPRTWVESMHFYSCPKPPLKTPGRIF